MKDSNLLNIYSPFDGMADTITKEILGTVGLKKDLSLPTVAMLLNSDKQLRAYCKDVFLKRSTGTGKYGDVALPIQLLQGALFTSLLYGYHIPSGKVGLYTADEKVITAISPSYEFKIDKTYDLNANGVLHALRVDISYDSISDFTPKLTRLTVKTNLVANDYIFVPLVSVHALYSIIEQRLNAGKVAFTKQVRAGVKKERFITKNATVLRKYSDDKKFASSISSKSYPQLMRHIAYFPVVGATSYTTGLTAIDLLLLDKLAFVKDSGSLVEVSEFTPIVKLIAISLITNELARVYSESSISQYNTYIEGIVDIISQSTFLDLVEEIDDKSDLLQDAIISLKASTNIVRGLSDEHLKSVWAMLSSKGVIDTSKTKSIIENLSKGFEKLITSDYRDLGVNISKQDLYSELDSGVLKVVVTKKDGSFSTMYVTNNHDVLSQVYGGDYISRFESMGVKIKKAEHYLGEGELTFDEVMEGVGLDEFIGKGPENPKDNLVTFKSLIQNDSDYSPRKKSSNENLVIARRLFGVVTDNGVENYYCNIDVTRIHEIIRVS